VEVQPHTVLTSALDGGEWSALGSGRFTAKERALGTHWTGGRLGVRAIQVKKVIDPSVHKELSNHCNKKSNYENNADFN
jgi:hypothetical protein